jgi:hypothetical protein
MFVFFLIANLCTFEQGWCNYAVGGNWRRGRGGTPSVGTGPSVDHTTGSSQGRKEHFSWLIEYQHLCNCTMTRHCAVGLRFFSAQWQRVIIPETVSWNSFVVTWHWWRKSRILHLLISWSWQTEDCAILILAYSRFFDLYPNATLVICNKMFFTCRLLHLLWNVFWKTEWYCHCSKELHSEWFSVVSAILVPYVWKWHQYVERVHKQERNPVTNLDSVVQSWQQVVQSWKYC